ncbi:helix-turn-helix domain-containing protein [Streptacidiphilus jiangxiensis]|uniref:PucR C-terminal helix-turn-helix domain-containing protein n=1 Tax=Streptacidiphilus jiangxiensis TaxID=235985 RepID=A0A1H7SKH7_STRJI|nr:helix-turn-helix domain-containing protein [Streptacidiphilus jiangxiensis]SEL73013.1 PucR C-terminal helix-turn-helix domain-containing protein [Streptacidiphilus jiangxiensis]
MTGPWGALPRGLAAELRKEQQTTAAEIIREIRQQVPEFSRPLAGQFGAGIQHGVESALAEFAELIEGARNDNPERMRVYRALGRGELAEGRSLDALQAAYRLGARVAWRRYARVARRVGLGTEQLVVLAEAIFAHIDELAAASVRGYAQAQADEAGALGRSRSQLLALLALGTRGAELDHAAELADWPLPWQLCAVALTPEDPARRTGGRRRGLPDLVLAELDGPDPWLLVPEPDLYLRDGQVRALLEERGGVIGPTVPPHQAGDSLRWARALRAALPRPTGQGSAGSAGGVVDGEEHLAALLLLADPPLVRLIAARRLRPLDELTPKQRQRLGDTLLAWLQTNRGSAPDVAARLGIHPQTARQRLHQVQRIFGPALADTDVRFELEIALRARNQAPGPAPATRAAGARGRSPD